MIHTSLYNMLKSNSQLVATFGGRVFHEWPPQSNQNWPVLVFQQVSALEFAEDMDQPSGEKIEQTSYQFDTYARSSADAVGAGDVVDSVLRSYRGTMGAVNVQHVQRVNLTHLGEIVGDKQVRRVSADYVIWYSLIEA